MYIVIAIAIAIVAVLALNVWYFCYRRSLSPIERKQVDYDANQDAFSW
jgi:hypothetical protein